MEQQPQLRQLQTALVDRYRVQSEIGRGGMATVYLAEDVKHHRPVAIKVLKPELAAMIGPERFLREIEIAAHLAHPNILPLFDSGQTPDGLLYYVMPYVDGESLRDRLERECQLPVEEAVEIAKQIAGALGYAHSCGVVHRDIKPENILFVAGHAVIADFGVARAITSASDQRLTETGLCVGTPTYMSPEQANAEPNIDGRSDICSLATVLYEMLGGEPPFAGPSLQAIIARRLTESPTSLRRTRDTVPPHVDRAIIKALARIPADRFATAEQFAQALTDHGISVGDVVPEERRPAARRRRLSFALAGGALVAASIWFVLGPLSPYRSPTPVNEIRSIVVLPFENRTGDAAENYFVDGIHEALIADLASVSGLRVISRTSAIRYRGTNRTIPQIASELNVDAVIEGSVLRSGDSVRIQASLIHAATDSAAGTVTYVRDLRNVMGLLTDAARGIATELAAVATPNEAESQPERLVDPAAYEAYLRARHLMHDLQTDSWRDAVRFYQQAVALDSSFVKARTGLAGAYFTAGLFGAEPRDQAWAKAREIAVRAVELDDAAGEGYMVLGYLALYADWAWETAESMLLRALRLEPNNAFARHAYADLLMVQGDPEGSARQMEIARELDPLSPTVSISVIGHLFSARRFETALTESRRLRELFDRPAFGGYFPASSLWELGRYDEALEEFKARWSADPELVRVVDRAYAEAGPQGAMRAAADYQASLYPDRVSAGGVAANYARAGAIDESLDWLERAVDDRQPTLPHVAADPTFDSLRSHPRFQALLRRIGLSP